jgi:hypothetical protein
VTRIAYKGKAVRKKSTDDLNHKYTASNNTGQDKPLSLLPPVFMLMPMFILGVIIIYTMDVFDIPFPLTKKQFRNVIVLITNYKLPKYLKQTFFINFTIQIFKRKGHHTHV